MSVRQNVLHFITLLMKTRLLCLITAVFLMAATFSHAQTPAPSAPVAPSTNTPSTAQDRNSDNEQDSNKAFWQARFLNGGHYLIKLDRIAGVSKHEYIGNGAARVVEVTIASDSAVVARMYWLEPVAKDSPIAAGQIILNQAQQFQKQVAERVSPSAGKLQVVKDYPNTTHAHTVEYAVQQEAVLSSLYDSLLRAVNTGRGRIWSER